MKVKLHRLEFWEEQLVWFCSAALEKSLMRYSSHKSVSFGYRKSLQRIYLSVPLNSDSSNITVQPQEGSKPSAYPPFNRSSLSSPADFLFPSFQSLRCLKLCCFWYRALNMSMHVRSWWDLELYWYNGTIERRILWSMSEMYSDEHVTGSVPQDEMDVYITILTL